MKNVISLYNNYTDGNAPVYNGIDYLYFTYRMHGDPFFESGDLTNGWVSYKGLMYSPLSIKYDIVRNQVAILLPDSNSRVVPDNEFIDSFSLAKHTFINLKEDYVQNLYNTGFYDVLFNGHIQVVARRIKIMSDVIEDDAVIKIYTPSDHFYIHKEGIYYLVSNKKEVFRLFTNRKHQVKKLMRQQHIKFRRKDFENSLLKATAIYDQVIH
ncbi:MAG: hypothetical protein ACRDE8_12000 [Ginsengibacter sp.]